jgi:hypothetical protein
MSLGRTLLIFSVIILVIILVLVFAAPDAWAQCVGVCDSGSSTDSSGSGGLGVFGTTTTPAQIPPGVSSQSPQIATQTVSNATLSTKQIISTQNAAKAKPLPDTNSIREIENKRALQSDFIKKRQCMLSRPDLLAALDQPGKTKNAIEIQQVFEKAEREHKFSSFLNPEGPYGPTDLAKRVLFGNKTKQDVLLGIQTRKQDLLRQLSQRHLSVEQKKE